MPDKTDKKVKKKGFKAAKAAKAAAAEEPPSGKAASSPKPSPKSSPKASPKPAPKSSPKVAPKGSPKVAPASAPVKAADKEEAAKKAIALIKKGLKEEPDAQAGGHPFVPKEWSKELKPILGGYRKFVERCGHFKVVENDANTAMYTVHLNDGKAAPTRPQWEKQLFSAWQRYLVETPKAERNTTDFVDIAKKVATTGVGEASASPKMSPKTAPAKDAGNEKASKNKKKETAAAAADAEAEGEKPQKRKAEEGGAEAGKPALKKKKKLKKD